MEILSLSGTVAFDGVQGSSHLHMALLPEWEFAREPDAATGYDELVVRPTRTPQEPSD